MVNKNERGIIERYEQEGWKTLRGGAPDFVFLKLGDNGQIIDQVFVEVKSKDAELTYEQSVYRKIIQKLGAKYKVEIL